MFLKQSQKKAKTLAKEYEKLTELKSKIILPEGQIVK